VDRKVLEKVFDKPTLLAIHDLFNRGIFREFGSPVADGKEARVFTASNDETLAVKVYKIEASAFQNMAEYIKGDPRFWSVGMNHRAMVMAWVKKEYGNLKRMTDAGVSVPKPLAFRSNVLVMQFIGDSVPAPALKDTKIENPEKLFDDIVEDMRRMYSSAKLVHADLSEYNILLWEGRHYIIDVGQSVDLHHPLSEKYLERDINNVCRFFGKWIKTDPEKVKSIVKEEE
jgi:RIO kinase 1